jgi:hypothetical protein
MRNNGRLTNFPVSYLSRGWLTNEWRLAPALTGAAQAIEEGKVRHRLPSFLRRSCLDCRVELYHAMSADLRTSALVAALFLRHLKDGGLQARF